MRALAAVQGAAPIEGDSIGCLVSVMGCTQLAALELLRLGIWGRFWRISSTFV